MGPFPSLNIDKKILINNICNLFLTINMSSSLSPQDVPTCYMLYANNLLHNVKAIVLHRRYTVYRRTNRKKFKTLLMRTPNVLIPSSILSSSKNAMK